MRGPQRTLALQLLKRELSDQYLGTALGALWAVLSPLALLAVYAFIFVHIFQARLPGNPEYGFVPYLAIAFWPWTAFADSLLRGSRSVENHASLISRVAFPTEYLVWSTVTAAWVVAMGGYVAVLIVLAVTGTALHWSALPLLLPVLFLWYLFSLALAYLFSLMQVFLRDVQHALASIVTLWFFATPIIYPPDLVPEALRQWLVLNPAHWFVQSLREPLLDGRLTLDWIDAVAVVSTVALFFSCRWLFTRASRRFEDFL